MYTWTLETGKLRFGDIVDKKIEYFYSEEEFTKALSNRLEEGRVISYAEKCGGEED